MPKFCNAAHQVSWFGTQHLSSTLKEFLLFDCEIPQPASSARMQQRFAKKFAIRRVYQGMGSQNPLQRRKRSARSKQQAASREFHSLRSEEHTSELQSPCNLVCRLLLEKKKKTSHSIICAVRQW